MIKLTCIFALCVLATVAMAQAPSTRPSDTMNSTAIPPAAVIPGLNADPTLVAFKGRYYLYPTTDGSVGWKATSFQAWSSTNLVAWKNEGVILDIPRDITLGVSSNVPARDRT